jgi:hypothetical protein
VDRINNLREILDVNVTAGRCSGDPHRET